MQYANVYVKHRLDRTRTLTYQIPPRFLADISIGCLVDVPFRNKTIQGVIIAFTRRPPLNVTPLPIKNIRSKGAVITPEHILFYSNIAEITLTTLADVLFYFTPPLTKYTDNGLIGRRRKSSGQLKVVRGTLHERFERYKNLIGNYKGSLLIIFPDLDIMNSFKSFIKNKTILVLHSKKTAKQRWEIWYDSQNNHKTILTTRQGIGLLPPHPSIIVIDEPDHPGYKEDRRPKFQIQELIQARLRLGDNIILGINQPNLLQNYLFNIKPTNNLPPSRLVKVSSSIMDILIENIKDTKNVLIVLPQKGEYGAVMCRDCQNILRCPKCNKVLVQKNGAIFYCYSCQKSYAELIYCPVCQSTKLVGFSIGTDTVSQSLKRFFSNRRITQIDTQTKLKNYELKAGDILIGTHKVLDYPLPKTEKVICLGFDSFLDIPAFDQEEKILLTLHKFISLGQRSIILTKRPEHRVFHTLASNTYIQTFSELLKERTQNLPPFSRLVVIKSKKNYSEIFLKKLQSLLRLKDISISKTDFEYELRIYVPRHSWLAFRDLIKELPSTAVIDPDPRFY